MRSPGPSPNERLVTLVDRIQQHLVNQDQRGEQIADSLAQLARTLAELPESARRQSETLSAIASQIEAGNRNTQSLSASLKDVPRLAGLQTETLAGIRTQLDRANNLDSEMSLSLQSFGKAVGGLKESTQAQVSTLSSLAGQAAQRDARLGDLLRQQTRRFTMLFVVTIVVAALAIAAAVSMLVVQWLTPPTG